MKLVSISFFLFFFILNYVKSQTKCCENCFQSKRKFFEIPKSNSTFCLETCLDDEDYYKLNLLSHLNVNKSNMIINPCNELGYTKYIKTKNNYDYYTNKKLKINFFKKNYSVR